jgi:coatomer subunit beta'
MWMVSAVVAAADDSDVGDGGSASGAPRRGWIAAAGLSSAAVVGCFVRDGRSLSVRSMVLWLALLLLAATPVLSGFSVVFLSLLAALPLQLLIHRHHRNVTAETQKLPPRARVKAVDVCAVRPPDAAAAVAVDLVALAYYSGHVVVWNLAEGSARGASVCRCQPLRAVRFLRHEHSLPRPRGSSGWARLLAAAGDDGRLVLLEVRSDMTIAARSSVAAHPDFCRSVDAHPSLPLVLSASDDCSVKVWQVTDGDDDEDSKRGFALLQSLEAHDDFVMQVRCHPDGTSLVSASLDRKIHKWSIEGSQSGAGVVSPTPAATFRGHTEGVNCVEFMIGGDGSTLLVSGSDDCSIRIWNYQSTALIRSISNSHRDNVNALAAHPSLPLLVSACEDGTCRAWSVERTGDDATKRQSAGVSLRGVWNLDEGRAWALAWVGGDEIALGFDQGPVILRMESSSNDSTGRCKVKDRARSLARIEYENADGSSPLNTGNPGRAESTLALRESMVVVDAEGVSVPHVIPAILEPER